MLGKLCFSCVMERDDWGKIESHVVSSLEIVL